MKVFSILALLLLVLIIGGLVYIASTDVPVEQTTITRDIPTTDLK